MNVYIKNNHPSGEYNFDVNFETNDDIITQTVYIYSTGITDCVSISCIEESRSIYFLNFALSDEERKIIEDDVQSFTNAYHGLMVKYENFVHEKGDIEYNSPVIIKTPEKNIVVTGKIKWCDNTASNQIYSLVNNYVYLYEVNNNKIKYESQTDENGTFTFTISENEIIEDKLSFYIALQPENDAVTIVKFFKNYQLTLDILDNIEIGTKISYEIKIITNNSKRAAAYEIPQSMGYVRNYIKEMEYFTTEEIDKKLPQIIVYYPGKDKGGCYYSSLPRYICIDKNAYNSWDPCMHEYGHYVDDVFNLASDIGGSHYSGDDLIYEKGKKNGLKLCYSEALASYLGMSAQHYYKLESLNFHRVGDYSYNYSLNYDTYLLNLSDGECNENTTIGLLLSIADDVKGRSYDNMAYGYRNLWNIIKSYKHSYMSELIEDLINKNDPNVIKNLGGLLAHFGFAPNIISDNSIFVTNVNSTTNKFEWLVNTCNGNSSVNNQYSLIFYSSSLYDKYEIKNITDTMYVLNDIELNNILALEGDELYWQVAGYNTKTFATGPYISKISKIKKPIEEKIYINEEYTKPLEEDESVWYKFIVPFTGVYKFYTTGNEDTYGEIFSSIVSNKTNTNILAFNDDGGDKFNFLIEYNLKISDIIYLRVRQMKYMEMNDYLLKVECKEHNHEFKYKTLDSSYHILKCSCGETSGEKERHVFSSNPSLLAAGNFATCMYCKAKIKVDDGFYPIIKNNLNVCLLHEFKNVGNKNEN